MTTKNLRGGQLLPTKAYLAWETSERIGTSVVGWMFITDFVEAVRLLGRDEPWRSGLMDVARDGHAVVFSWIIVLSDPLP